VSTESHIKVGFRQKEFVLYTAALLQPNRQVYHGTLMFVFRFLHRALMKCSDVSEKRIAFLLNSD